MVIAGLIFSSEVFSVTDKRLNVCYGSDSSVDVMDCVILSRHVEIRAFLHFQRATTYLLG
jgi:hypothetical protein